jgi:hypothetical protein
MTSTPHLQSRGRAFVVLAVLSVAAGCTSYTVKVDSLARENAEQPISYRIQNKKSPAGEQGPLPEEAAAQVRTALSGRGFYEAPPNAKADLEVEIDHGIGPPVRRRSSVQEPEYSTEMRKTVQRDGLWESVPPPPPTLKSTIVITTTYEKYLRLTARENPVDTNGRPPNEIWTVDVTSTGESADLAKSLPILVAASIEYIGRDSHGQKTVKLKDSDADVLFVKKGIPPVAER